MFPNFINTTSISLLRILNTSSKLLGIINELKPLYVTFNPLLKKVPDILNNISLVKTNSHEIKKIIPSGNNQNSLTFFN